MTVELSRSAREMIERAVADERALGADDARRARLKRTLLSGVAASGAGLLASTGRAATVNASTGVASLLPLVKGVGVGLLLSGAVAGGLHWVAEPPAPSTSPVGALTTVERTEPAPASDQAPAPVSVASAEPGAPQKGRAAVPVAIAASVEPPPAKSLETPGPALRAELELMSQVQAALRDDRGARALSLLERYDDAFPSGQLGTERLAAEVFAACQVGDVARARRVAARFLARDASSPLAERVKGACAKSEPTP